MSPDTSLSYNDALAFLDSLDVSAMKLGLDRMRHIMALMGDPQDTLPMIHIAGTNGKGSTAAMLTAALAGCGLMVGTFTSPHLVDVRERVAINGYPIPVDDFVREVSELKAFLESNLSNREDWPTYFEFLNVLAYRYFQNEAVNITVMETGLGGRLDSTNIVKKPDITVITGISWDHMALLGDTLGKIAAEKAGILKPGVPLVIPDTLPDEARTVILERARQLDVPVAITTTQRLQRTGLTANQAGQQFIDTKTGITWAIPMLGLYQGQNLALVLDVLDQLRRQGWSLPEAKVCAGLSRTMWPARCQYLPEHNLMIDGSHNIQGFESLHETMRATFPERPLIWVASLRNNREPGMMMDLITQQPNTQAIVWTQGQHPGWYHLPSELAEHWQSMASQKMPHVNVKTAEFIGEALASARQRFAEVSAQSQATPLIVVTGSLYVAGEALNVLGLGPQSSPRFVSGKDA